MTTTTGDRRVDNLSLHAGLLVKALLGDDGRTDRVGPRSAPARRAGRRPRRPQGSQAPRTEEPTR